MAERDSFEAMQAAVRAFHERHDFAARGAHDLVYRVALMAGELGEIADCATRDKPREHLAEECADLMILLLGTAHAANFDLGSAFWRKLEDMQHLESRMVSGRVRLFKPDGSQG